MVRTTAALLPEPDGLVGKVAQDDSVQHSVRAPRRQSADDLDISLWMEDQHTIVVAVGQTAGVLGLAAVDDACAAIQSVELGGDGGRDGIRAVRGGRE